MPKNILSDYTNHPCTDELTDSDWLQLGNAFYEMGEQMRSELLKELASHSGVAAETISTAFHALFEDSIISSDHKNIVASLMQSQASATLTIATFQQRSAVKRLHTESLLITRAEWLALIDKFEHQKGKHVTPVFFLHNLSMLRKVSYESLALTSSKTQPSRTSKRQSHFDESSAPKRWRPAYIEDDGTNPLILKSTDNNLKLQERLKSTGVRSTPLAPATPVKGYAQTARTPGKTKVRPVCTIGNNTFFKPLTPIGNKESRGRIDTSDASLNKITTALPRLLSDKAESIEFTATLESLSERSGVNRGQSQKSIMKATSADVFRAHGIEIQTSDNRAHHWSHLIAYFLGGEQDSVNLVPTTAAANYNTLETIELFIEKQLIQGKTNQIKIKVDPIYSGESLIPDMLIYTLTWGPEHHSQKQVFYINPTSYQRITKSMHESIEMLRDESDENTPKP